MKKLAFRIAEFALRLRNGVVVSNRNYENSADDVLDQDSVVRCLSDTELSAAANALRQRVAAGQSEIHPVKTMAIAREVAMRTLGMRPYRVQLIAALALNDHKCIEMHTGEGKTLAAALTVCHRALDGRGVHVLTFNDYLAQRDAEWMRPLFNYFGLTVGYVVQGMPAEQRRAAYLCDVTYVTAKEAGFDFLRDQSCASSDERVHRGFHFALVDEADSCFIDEARIPLVLATDDDADDMDLYNVANTIRQLSPGRDYTVLAKGRNCSFTDHGIAVLESELDCGELHSEENVHILSRLNVALHAELLLKRDVDYIVREQAIELIDEFTGRVADNRRWPGGLQAALEAKEGLPIQPQGRILNSITMQYFLELYDQFSGMSGTALVSTGELQEFYDLKVVVIPPNEKCVRADYPDNVFTTANAKIAALVAEIACEHNRGRPILVGTASVAESEGIADRLKQAGIECRVLNASNDFQEAEIIAEADMAGRGTDIRLGGSGEQNRDAVVQLGGLYVIGTNRHESRRIDNQLRGRAGRQGDPGESRFFVSLQDNLLRRFGITPQSANFDSDKNGLIMDAKVGDKISHLQRVIEGESFDIRRTLRKYAFLLERQRREIYDHRVQLAAGRTIPTILRDAEPEFYQRLVHEWGETQVLDAERQVTLRHFELRWSDHLEHASEIREGIHLVSLGGFDAFSSFNTDMNRAFQQFKFGVEQAVVQTMMTATFTKEGIDLDREGLSVPASTWTYMINDNPRGGIVGQLTQGLVRMARNWFGK
ncbi:UNVERIFIED_CONTAM: hypothetical protein GTU68_061883 [Idotea baltica]|nr:hypothetical protein [Idotea baltica]